MKNKKYAIVEFAEVIKELGYKSHKFYTEGNSENMNGYTDNPNDVKFYFDVSDGFIIYNDVMPFNIEDDEVILDFDNRLNLGYENDLLDFIYQLTSAREATNDNFKKFLYDKYAPFKIVVIEDGETSLEGVENFLDSELIDNLESNIISNESDEFQQTYYNEKKELDLQDIDDLNQFLTKFYNYGWLSVSVRK